MNKIGIVYHRFLIFSSIMTKIFPVPQCWDYAREPGTYMFKDGGKLDINKDQFSRGYLKITAEARYRCPTDPTHICWVDIDDMVKFFDNYRCSDCQTQQRTGIPYRHCRFSVKFVLREYGFAMPDEDFGDIEPSLQCFAVTISAKSFTVDLVVDGEVVESITYH